MVTVTAAASAVSLSPSTRSAARNAPGAERPEPTIAVELTDLTKKFAPRRAMLDVVRQRGRTARATVVDQVSFAVAEREMFGVLGPNGAGKTTIFKMLSTMIVPDGGTATVAGYDVVRDATEVRRVLAAVPADERSLNWRLSAYENLALFAGLQKVSRRETAQRIDSLLHRVGLSDAGAKLVGTFSSGMRQRLLIARALVGQPSILLLDEPTRSLDPISAQEFREFLRRDLVGREGCTIVLATHNTDEAFTFCDRVAVLHRGRVLATGPAATLAARYGEERYRLLTRDASHPAFAMLERSGRLRGTRAVASVGPEWTSVECVIPGGASSTSEIVRDLTASGVSVARLERADMSLADLIGSIIAAEPETAHA